MSASNCCSRSTGQRCVVSLLLCPRERVTCSLLQTAQPMSSSSPATPADSRQQPQSSTSPPSAAAVSATATSALQLVLRNLSDALVYTDTSNIDTNKKLWNQYAANYYTATNITTPTTANTANTAVPTAASSPSPWVQKMASQVGRTVDELQFIGDEWSDAQSLDRCLSHWLYPLLSESSVVAEIGSGGGRVASRVAGRVKQLVCFDISDRMLAAARTALAPQPNCSFHLLPSAEPSPASFPSHYHRSFHTVYMFDVLVHCTPHTIYAYLLALHSLLVPHPSSRLLLHYADLCTPLGWERFKRQRDERAGGFCFVGREQMRAMCERAGWEVMDESECASEADWQETGNVYEQRDRLCVLRSRSYADTSGTSSSLAPPP